MVLTYAACFSNVIGHLNLERKNGQVFLRLFPEN